MPIFPQETQNSDATLKKSNSFADCAQTFEIDLKDSESNNSNKRWGRNGDLNPRWGSSGGSEIENSRFGALSDKFSDACENFHSGHSAVSISN